MQYPYCRFGLVIEDGKQNAVSIFALTVQQLANFLAKEGVFPGDGAPTGHGFETGDRGHEVLIPVLSPLRAGVLGKAQKGGISFGFAVLDTSTR
jgi:hypothetical protein